jgi:hypothetical protein
MILRSFFVVISLLLTIGSIANAELKPGAHYFSGQVKVARSQPTTCYVEMLFSRNAGQAQVRSISTLQHLSAAGQLIWIGVGPYTANYFMERSLYRYQDQTPRALVKDLVVNLSNQGTPLKHAILFWHNQAGHHDPVICEDLIEKTSAQDLREVEKAFARFDELKP